MRKSSVILFGLLALISTTYLIQCAAPQNKGVVASYLNLHDSVQYVGMQTCAQCHADKFETFVHTGMGSSFGLAERDRSSAKFGNEHVVYDSSLDLFYAPSWRNDSLFITEFRLKDGDTTHQRSEHINYIIGSGHHTNSHLMLRNGFVFQAPITFYTQKGQWDLAPGMEAGNNSRFTRVIDEECMTCHNGLGKMHAQSSRRFEKIGSGIDCERCHGPGEKHVYFRSGGGVPNGDIDSTIVNPTDLSFDYQIDLCQRCHLQGNNVLKPGKRFSDFRPGMRLKEVFEVYLPDYEGDESLFNMANHSERLQLSACFKGTEEGGLTCITCHNPHVSVRSLGENAFIASCMNCHTDESCKETIDVRLTKDDNCIACHMPPTGAEDIPHVTVHDHKIGVFKEGGNNEKHGDPIGLRCINNPDPEDATLAKAYLTYFEKYDQRNLYRDKAREILDRIDAPFLEIHYYFQSGQLKEITAISERIRPDDASAMDLYRIGEAYAGLKEYTKAEEWMKLSTMRSPQRFEMLNRYGYVLMRNDKLDDAQEILQKALALNPQHKGSLNNMAKVYFQMGNLRRAKEFLQDCLELDPYYMPGLRTALNIAKFEKDQESVTLYKQRLSLR